MRNRVPRWVIVSIALQLAMVSTLRATIITDIVESGGTGAYGLVDSVGNGGPGLQEGSLAYMDRTYTWTPTASYLIGSEYVITRNNDLGATNLSVAITFGESAYVYLFDCTSNSQVVPVSGATFADVGTNEIVSANFSTTPFLLRKATVAPNTTITLERDQYLMWGLAVQPVPEPSGVVLALLGISGLAAMGRRHLRGRERRLKR